MHSLLHNVYSVHCTLYVHNVHNVHNVYSVHYICAHLLNFAHTAEKSEDPVCAECARDFDKASLDSPSANREIITFSSKVFLDFPKKKKLLFEKKSQIWVGVGGSKKFGDIYKSLFL